MCAEFLIFFLQNHKSFKLKTITLKKGNGMEGVGACTYKTENLGRTQNWRKHT